MFGVEYNLDNERQQFKYHLEEPTDIMSGTIANCDILFPMTWIELKIRELEKALGKITMGNSRDQIG